MTAPTIAAVRTILVRLALPRPMAGPFGWLEARHNLVVVVETRDGVRGLGEVWSNFPPWGCGERHAIVDELLAGILVGETLDDPARLYREMHRRARLLSLQWGAPGPVHQAIAGTDIALWDAFARHAGKPLRRALSEPGHSPPDAIPVYASGIGPDDTVERIEAARAAGHVRFKIRIPFKTEVNRRMLRAARAAAGEAPLMADGNQALSLADADALAPDLRAARLDWLEEPFPVDEVDNYRSFAARSPVPLAWGENARGLDGLQACIDSPAQVIQPDITKTLGISEGLEAGRRVVAAGKRLCFHMYGGPLGVRASAELSAAIAGSDWLETDANPNPLYDRLVDAPLLVRNGRLLLSERPGLGVDLAREFDQR
ncbi:MAG: mandelate racemase/muconate lactonizing enzyme family protein [Alphaproteobacteria bacterium]|nr:mandelate racemase/muconate lactonizing enzyme family protein [Alphaproteobacteria bacterium]